jgi:hypothetical protein
MEDFSDFATFPPPPLFPAMDPDSMEARLFEKYKGKITI